MSYLRIGLAQINTTTGDLDFNTNKIIEYIKEARGMGIDLLSFPELALTGYPLNDLLFKSHFLESSREKLEKIISSTRGIAVVMGLVYNDAAIHNSAAVIRDGELLGFQHKRYLQNYGVFDEFKCFRPGITGSSVFKLDKVTLGVSISEDIWWHTSGLNYQQNLNTVELVVNISASQHHPNKYRIRRNMLSGLASNNIVVIAFNNLVGRYESLEFEGGSMVIDQRGRVISQGKLFEEEFVVADINLGQIIKDKLSNPKYQGKKKEGRGKPGKAVLEILSP